MKYLSFKNLKKAIKEPIKALSVLFHFNLCYSQTGEDLILNRLLKDKQDGLYIDIGANHPIIGSNTYFFYRKGWKGITVEPNKKFVKLFKYKRPKDTHLQLGIGKTGEGEKTLNFSVFDCDALSTCDNDTVERYRKAGYKVIDNYEVPIWSLEKLCDKYAKGKTIDILSIDVEGADMNVLESNNRNKYKPKYIVLETVEYAENGSGTWEKNDDEFNTYLKNKGYKIVADTGINTIYGLK